ncbi:MAG TPA: HypC/HybG/HupF family hydrogenase formation chaperone [Candidatus Acidoferrales bacterium]|nr:HypC/HybG/HupF family hydrogenase formation chaperone [Candidatus Acidoferrales bacterium]
MKQMSTDGEAEIPPGGCHMCLAIPGKIVELVSDNPNSAMVDVVGMRRRVDLGLLEEDRPVPGDWVLIHVGFAMSKISEVDAIDQMKTLEMLGECEAAVQEVRGYGLEETDEKQAPQDGSLSGD